MYEALLIIHILAFSAGIGMSITFAVQSAFAGRMPPEEAGRFMALASRAAIIAQARADPAGPGMARAEAFGKAALITSVLAVVAAVLTFN
jgi:hypothetical protein